MTYPPQPGGWPDQQGGYQNQPGGWQDPAGYANPASGQPTYIDPVSGQPTPYPDSTGYAPPQQYPTSPGYAGYPGYSAPVMVPSQRTNGMSIASLVVSLVGLVSLPCYGIGGIVIGLVGAILGHVGRRQVTERGESGGGMALAGIIIGWISVLIGLVVLGFVIYFVWYVTKNLPDTYPTPYYS